MMEDTGEDVLRSRPNVVTTFFKRLGHVSLTFNDILVPLYFFLHTKFFVVDVHSWSSFLCVKYDSKRIFYNTFL